MRGFCRSIAAMLFLYLALNCEITVAEVPDLKVDQLEAQATTIIDGKLVRIYNTLEQEGEWEYTRSVAEIRVSHVEKGKYDERVAYVRFWHKRFIGKGKSPLGAFGQRKVPAVGSEVCAYLRDGEDGGLDVVSPNGLKLITAAAATK